MMTEGKESSVLFSLRELMDLEQQRIEDERATRARKAELEAEAALEAERRAEEEVRARRLAEEATARTEVARAREEAAHLSAIREAAVERARREASAELELETMRAQQSHERELRVLGADKQQTRLTTIALGLGVALVATLLGGGAYLHAGTAVPPVSPGVIESREALRGLEAQLRAQREQVADLQKAAQAAREARERAAASAPVGPTAHTDPPAGTRPTATAGHVPKAPTPKLTACANEYDPMCGTLP